jgi:hypothetical protein
MKLHLALAALALISPLCAHAQVLGVDLSPKDENLDKGPPRADLFADLYTGDLVAEPLIPDP